MNFVYVRDVINNVTINFGQIIFVAFKKYSLGNRFEFDSII